MAADLSRMRQSELVRLLNSTPLGEVTSERQVVPRSRAGGAAHRGEEPGQPVQVCRLAGVGTASSQGVRAAADL